MKKIISLLFAAIIVTASSVAVFAGDFVGYTPDDYVHVYYYEACNEVVNLGGTDVYTVSDTRAVINDFEHDYKEIYSLNKAVITVLGDAQQFEVHFCGVGSDHSKWEVVYPDGYLEKGMTGPECIKNIPAGTTYTINNIGNYVIHYNRKDEVSLEIVDNTLEWNGHLEHTEQFIYDNGLEARGHILIPRDKYNGVGVPVVARPTGSEIVIDGKVWKLDAYNINDNNYFKLRDIAMTFSHDDSGCRFEVMWDSDKNAITIETNAEYSPVGGECGGYNAETGKWPDATANEGQDKPLKDALRSSSEIYVNNQKAAFTAYNIDGNNYFKLRDLAYVLNFSVTWNGLENRIYVDTSMPYVED